MKPRILSLITAWHRATVFHPKVWADLTDTYEVATARTEPEADALLATCDAVMTGWGTTYAFTAERMLEARRLRIVAHTAGSVKGLLAEAPVRDILRRRNIVVFSGGDGLAMNVAEATIGYLILAMRRWPALAGSFSVHRRPGIAMPEDDPPRNGQFLTGATIGLVGLSTVARFTLPLLSAFGCRVLAYDPYVCPDDAEAMGVTQVGLDDLFRLSDAVSLHVPELPQTIGLIGARQLGLLRDGGTLVNTARGAVVDHAALLKECVGGRINAALDVTHPEPLPEDSPFWSLPNVLITPHIAAQGSAGLYRVGEMAAAAIRDAQESRPIAGMVPMHRWETIA